MRQDHDDIAPDLAARSREELIDYARALEQQALHDPLTGLPNRALLADRLDRSAAAAHRNGTTFAVLLCDLDGFKEVNDRHGHLAGDVVLRETADRLRRVLRASDSVARLGGDEFAILLPDTDPEGARIVAGKVAAAVGRPIDVGGKRVVVGVSIGAALYPRDGHEPGALLRSADDSMYGQKVRRQGTSLRKTKALLAAGALVAGLGALLTVPGGFPGRTYPGRLPPDGRALAPQASAPFAIGAGLAALPRPGERGEPGSTSGREHGTGDEDALLEPGELERGDGPGGGGPGTQPPGEAAEPVSLSTGPIRAAGVRTNMQASVEPGGGAGASEGASVKKTLEPGTVTASTGSSATTDDPHGGNTTSVRTRGAVPTKTTVRTDSDRPLQDDDHVGLPG